MTKKPVSAGKAHPVKSNKVSQGTIGNNLAPIITALRGKVTRLRDANNNKVKK